MLPGAIRTLEQRFYFIESIGHNDELPKSCGSTVGQRINPVSFSRSLGGLARLRYRPDDAGWPCPRPRLGVPLGLHQIGHNEPTDYAGINPYDPSGTNRRTASINDSYRIPPVRAQKQQIGGSGGEPSRDDVDHVMLFRKDRRYSDQHRPRCRRNTYTSMDSVAREGRNGSPRHV